MVGKRSGEVEVVGGKKIGIKERFLTVEFGQGETEEK